MTCVAVFGCPTPPSMPHATYTQPVPSSVIYTCNTGYQFTDGASNHLSVCLTATNTWSYVSPCVRSCGQPTVTPANAVIINNTNMSTYYHSNVTYQCNLGYWVSNGVFSSISTCQADGTWSAVPDCIRK